jgi:cytochrome c553
MCKKQTSIVATALVSLLVALLLQAGFTFQKNAWADPLADPPKDAKDKTYVGRAKCASCHLKENTSWKKMKHSQAFEDLSANYKEDKSCLACHVTGFGEPTGFKDAKASPQLAAVVCEACHGPGSAHAKIGDAMAKKEKDKSYWTKDVQSEEWKKDNELRKQAINRIKIPGITVEEKGQFKGKNLHEMFEEFKNDKGEPVNLTADVCKKCHTSENGKKTHPDYKK